MSYSSCSGLLICHRWPKLFVAGVHRRKWPPNLRTRHCYKTSECLSLLHLNLNQNSKSWNLTKRIKIKPWTVNRTPVNPVQFAHCMTLTWSQLQLKFEVWSLKTCGWQIGSEDGWAWGHGLQLKPAPKIDNVKAMSSSGPHFGISSGVVILWDWQSMLSELCIETVYWYTYATEAHNYCAAQNGKQETADITHWHTKNIPKWATEHTCEWEQNHELTSCTWISIAMGHIGVLARQSQGTQALSWTQQNRSSSFFSFVISAKRQALSTPKTKEKLHTLLRRRKPCIITIII